MSNGIESSDRWSNVIDSNSVNVSNWAININNGYGTHEITNNAITKTGGSRILYATQTDSVIVTNNTCLSTGSGDGFYFYNTYVDVRYNLITTAGRGIHCENQIGGEIGNNTIVSSGSGDYGVHITNLSAPVVRNNIIQGFQNGIYADNTLVNYSLS